VDNTQSDSSETSGKKGKRRGRPAEPPENTIEVGRARATVDDADQRRLFRDNQIDSTAGKRDERTSSDARPGRRGTASESQWGPESVPLEVRERYVRLERKYFLPNGDEAFRDQGSKLTTRSENIEIIRDMVKIAAVRYGEEITVSGSERFRRTVWEEAQLANITVRGFSPTREDEAQLVRTIARGLGATPGGPATETPAEPPATRVEPAPNRGPHVDAAARSNAAVPRGDRPVFGELLDHGREHFQFDRHEDMSYFIKLRTERGERILWGQDLERALSKSKTQPQIGDRIGVRHLGQETVTVIARERDSEGRVKERPKTTHRNEWMVESENFFQERARAAGTVRDSQIQRDRATEQHPQLVGTYLALGAAEKIAAQRFASAEDRQRFVAMAREVIAQAIERGDPLLSPKLRDQQRATTRTAEPRAATVEAAHVPS
jgi:putative DNA primase/helicase